MLLPVLGFILFFWLGALSFLLFRTVANYNRLTRGATDKTLSEIFKEFLEQEKLTHQELKDVRQEMRNLGEESQKFIQKIGVVRFNPFSDTGGDQSFTLALLDGKNNGIVVTSLYARSGVRWYVKRIKNGRGIEHELSKEETEAVRISH